MDIFLIVFSFLTLDTKFKIAFIFLVYASCLYNCYVYYIKSVYFFAYAYIACNYTYYIGIILKFLFATILLLF